MDELYDVPVLEEKVEGTLVSAELYDVPVLDEDAVKALDAIVRNNVEMEL